MQLDPVVSSGAADRGRRAWVAATLLRRPGLLPRFTLALERLRALPRGARRRIQRRAAVSLAGAALLLALSSGPLLTPRAHAASITVGGTCSLVDAIRSANNDTSIGTCAAGSGDDVISLTGNVTLTSVYGDYNGYTGLPLIASTITIDGNGFTISRDGAAPDFRLLTVDDDESLTLSDVTLSGGRNVYYSGGGVFLYDGADLTVTNSTFSGNNSGVYGGAIYGRFDSTINITGSTLSDNYASEDGAAVYGRSGSVITVTDSTMSGNDVDDDGGAITAYFSTVSITGSTLSGNTAGYGGGGAINIFNGELTLVNSTISDNSSYDDGGGIHVRYGDLTVTQSTITGNSSGDDGGGIFLYEGYLDIRSNILSGNSAGGGVAEIAVFYAVASSSDNVFGHSGISNSDAYSSFWFTPDASDVTATSDSAQPTALAAILNTTLADNGGPTMTHALVSGSPAIDLAATGESADQRGYARPYGAGYDAGAYEYGAGSPAGSIFVSAQAGGDTDDALAFGPHDILEWDGSAWSKWFDGSAAGLTPNGKNKHNLAGFWIPDPAEDDVLLAFVQNARFVPGITGKVDGMDLVWWDGSAFSLWFDGQDVGLTNKTNEKIDALHVLDGSLSPVGGSCLNYLLISTQGAGQVPGAGGPIKFGGEDVLGFCQTNAGPSTTGFWHKLLDGSDEGVPRNAINGLSFSDDGQTMYLTSHGNFNVDAANGGHSMVYEYDFSSGDFSGPNFSAPAAGLHEKVNGLHVDGVLP